MFDEYLGRWSLKPDGKPITTATSRLLPVLYGEVPAMLKVAVVDEEKVSGVLMTWWNGHGAAVVLAHEGNAVLMERAVNGLSLAELARNGHDEEATRILCSTATRLHDRRGQPPPGLRPLDVWFSPLKAAAHAVGGVLQLSANAASHLLATQQDVGVLHGDIHHGNVLNFGSRGWLAIDPKGLFGDRCFDYANILCNPDNRTALLPGRFEHQLNVLATAGGLEHGRLLTWVMAWTGLAAAFNREDGLPMDAALRLAELAAAKLNHSPT